MHGRCEGIACVLAPYLGQKAQQRMDSLKRDGVLLPGNGKAISQSIKMVQTEPQHDAEALMIRRAAGGDMEAFRKLYDEYVDQVIHHVGRLLGPRGEVEDAVQEVFVRVHRSLKNYDGDCQFSTWLYRVTRKVADDHLRTPRKTVSLHDWRTLRAKGDAWKRLEARDQLRALYAALEKLNGDNREVFLLYEVEGLKLRAISEMMDLPIGTVASRVRRAREELGEILELMAGGE